jgi:hypothetical protein
MDGLWEVWWGAGSVFLGTRRRRRRTHDWN